MQDDNNSNNNFISKILNSIGDTILLAVKYVWAHFMDFLPAITGIVFDKTMEFMGNVEPVAWDGLIESYSNQGLFSKEQAENLKQLQNLTSPMDLIAFVWLSINLFGQMLQINTDAGGNFLRQSLNEQLRSNLPDYREVIQAAFIAPELTGQVRDLMSKHGITEEHKDLLFLSAYRLYNEDIVRQLYLRGEITKEYAVMRMRELGYTDTRSDEIFKLWEVIPPIQDIITMVAKEAFEDNIVQKIGLDAEFPKEQSEWLSKQGLSKYWQLKYWRAHWDEPSIQQGYEMLHRQDPDNPGNSIIDLETLDELYRITEIPPFWRDKLTKIAYQPYTRVDVRRMHALGILNDDQLYWSYRDNGYDHEHAINMAKFTVGYNAQTDKDISQSQIMRAYTNGLVGHDDTLSLLMQLGYTEARGEFIITNADFQQQLDRQDELIDNVKLRFQDNLITKLDAQNILGQLNLDGDTINLYIDTWEVKRLKNQKKPSKTDLDKMLKKKIINSDEYRTEMAKLGYGYKYVEWYEQLSKKS